MSALAVLRLCLLIVLLSIPNLAVAQQACPPRSDLLQRLSEEYGESPIALGLTNSGVMVELLARPDGSTWTIIVSRPDGVSCPIAAGQNWRAILQEEEL